MRGVYWWLCGYEQLFAQSRFCSCFVHQSDEHLVVNAIADIFRPCMGLLRLHLVQHRTDSMPIRHVVPA